MRAFTKVFLIGVAVTFLFLSCSKSSQTSDQPILPKHYLLDQMHRLGKYEGRYFYIDPEDDPRLKNGYVAGVYVATEFQYLLIKNPDDDEMAIFYPGEDQTFKDLLFKSVDEDSTANQVWSIASGKVKPEETMTGDDGKIWARVDIQATKKQSSIF